MNHHTKEHHGCKELLRGEPLPRFVTRRPVFRGHRRATLARLFVWALAADLVYWPMSADARPRVPWPADGEVRIYNPTGWQNTMRAAADAWNRTGVTPTIVFTSRHSSADVVVDASSRKLDQRCDEDYRCDGFAERRGDWWRITLRDADRDTDRHASAARVRLAAHELGHILGLPHNTHDCALMNTDTGAQRCSQRVDFANIRGPMHADIAAAERLYDRELRLGYQPWCALGARQERAIALRRPRQRCLSGPHPNATPLAPSSA